jgi:hypothetical protein
MKSHINASQSTSEQADKLTHEQPDYSALPDAPARSGNAKRIQMLGGSGVGKTCFLAGLALLNEQTDGRIFVLPTDDETKAVFETLRETLSKGSWPAKTNIVNKLSFAVVRGKVRVDVELSDFKGEDFTDAMRRGNTSEASQQIQSLVSDADVLLVLLDGASVDQNKDFPGAPLIQAVFQRLSAEGRGDLEVAVVLTKSDLCRSTPVKTSDDLKQLVQKRAPDLARFLQEQGVQTQWTPASVCGPNATDDSGAPIYAALAPQGYDEIFEQLFKRPPPNRIIRFVAAAALLMVVLVIAWTALGRQEVHKQKQRITDRSIPIQEITESIFPANIPLVRERYDEDFAQAKTDIEACGNFDSIELVLKRFAQIPAAHESLVSSSLEYLKATASRRKEELLYKQVIDCKELQTADCGPLISMYLREFPDGLHAEELRKILNDINQARYLTARSQVKAIPVTSTESLKKKSDAITRFLKDYGEFIHREEKAAITSARDVAIDLIQQRQYNCKLIRTSGLDEARKHGVKISVDQTLIANYDDSGKVTEKNWNRNFTINWKSGQKIEVAMVYYGLRTQNMAYFEDSSPIAIALLASQRTPTSYVTPNIWWGEDFAKIRPSLKIKFECQELPPEKLRVIQDYLLPGAKW